MPPEDLPLCELWDLTRPALPPRSRLYPLEPIGLGTPYVESLTGYVARLADAHGVSVRTLVVAELLPLLGRAHLAKHVDSSLSAFWSKDARALNSTRNLAQDWVQALAAVTLRPDLRLLTWLPWSTVVSPLGLLRPTRAWCPECYQEWQETGAVVYEPLLWTLQAVPWCPRHHQPLQTACPRPQCRPTQPPLGPRSRPGYCAYCGQWLGARAPVATAEGVSTEEAARAWSTWAVTAIGELLAAAPQLVAPPRKERIAQAVAAGQDQIAGGQLHRWARELGVSVGAVEGWRWHHSVPRLDLFLRLCYRCGLSPLALLTAEHLPELAPRNGSDWLPIAPATQTTRRPFATEALQQALEEVLARHEEPPPSMREIARRLGYNPTQLHPHFRDLCRQISARYLAYRKEQGRARRQVLCAQVRVAANQLSAQGIYPSAYRIALLIDTPGFVRHPDAIAERNAVLREQGWER